VVEAQDTWLQWLDEGGAEVEDLRDDAKAVLKWIDGQKAKRIAQAAERRSGDSPGVLDTDEDEEALLARFAAAMRSGAALGVERADGKPSRLVLLPRRTDFVEYVCFAGWLYPTWRSGYWNDGLSSWTHCRIGNEALAIALQYADPGMPWEEGLPMNDRTPTGLRQQIAQLAAQQLFDAYYGARIPAAFASGLAMNMVIDRYGEVITRVDGDLSGNRTGAIESFVRGGQSEGGVLGVNRADSRWRQDDGKYRFVRALRKAQKEGFEANKRDAEDRVSSFLLVAGPGDDGRVVEAPFLGGGEPPKLPDKYTGDFAELMRSYGCAFAFWMKTEAGGRGKDSPHKFVEFLSALADPHAPAFSQLVEQVYGEPLSDSRDMTAECLEGEFLAWIAKQKSAR
jgi:hypothetical protein